MLPVKSIDHIRMYVRNLETSVSFYNSLFGFKTYEDDGIFKIIGNEDIKLCLQEIDIPVDSNTNGIQHFGFWIDMDFSLVEPILKKMRISFSKSEWEQTESTSLYIEDPDGYRIELSSKKGGGLDH